MTHGSLVDGLLSRVASSPDHTAIRAGRTTWTYADLWDRSGRVGASLLGRLGLRPGDRIGILGLNDPGYVAAYFGILRAGCVAVPLNQFLLATELADQLELVGARLCLVGRIDSLTVSTIAGRLPTVPIDDLLSGTERPLPPVEDQADATILLTSGTTGSPKGAVHTHATMCFAISELHRALPFSADDVMLAFLPFFAALPEQILPTLLAGGRVVIRPSWREAPAPAELDVAIDPGQAFGTGAHPTTRMCVELLVELADEGEAAGPLADLGTGSAVLAIVAAKLGWSPVLGVDSEAAAVEAARENAAANAVSITVERLNLREAPPPRAETIVANLTAPLLRDVATALTGRPPARLVCSGLLRSEYEEVASSFESAGLRVAERRDLGDWTALLLVRTA